MKIIYKKTVMQQIYEAKVSAMESHKEIEKIFLTPDEWQQLKVEEWPFYTCEMALSGASTATQIVEVAGVIIEVQG